jgi:hypothetical protein
MLSIAASLSTNLSASGSDTVNPISELMIQKSTIKP